MLQLWTLVLFALLLLGSSLAWMPRVQRSAAPMSGSGRRGGQSRAERERVASALKMSSVPASPLLRQFTPRVPDPVYQGIAVSGFVEKSKNFADPFVFSSLFHSGKWRTITTITDDVPFAKKRLVNPNTVYSGLIDVIKYAEVKKSNVDMDELEAAVGSNEAWMAFGVSSKELPAMASLAAKLATEKKGLKRVVFAVKVEPEESGEGVVFEEVQNILSKANAHANDTLSYTIFKYGEARKMGESKFPYRIARGELAVPKEGEILSSDDLMRVLCESVDLRETFNAVYNVGSGSNVDTEMLVYMKSRGWPERVQITMLVGPFMSKIEERYASEQKKRELKEQQLKEGKLPAIPAASESKENKYAGFFS